MAQHNGHGDSFGHGDSLRAHFLCYAMVDIAQMSFESGVRDYDEANVRRLLGIFKEEGCRRDDPATYIPALAPDVDTTTWRQDGEGVQDLRRGYATLAFRCLHGKHRVLAAQRFLPHREKWWTVALYSSSMVVERDES